MYWVIAGEIHFTHEANIQVGGKTTHVVCKYLSRSQSWASKLFII
jgi:hypothetical protein